VEHVPEVDAQRASAVLDRDGCVVITGVTSLATRDALRADLARLEGANSIDAEAGPDAFYPGQTVRTTALVAKSGVVRALVTHPVLLGQVDRLLLPSCDKYTLNVCSALTIGPGAREQILHREDGTYPAAIKPVLGGTELVVWSMWAISEFTADNGATLVVPGSHAWAAGRAAQPSEIARAVMPAGSLLICCGGLLHGAGANVSTGGEWRCGIFASYTLGWLRQEENMYIDCPPEIARGFSAQLSRLVGYDAHGALGFFDVDALARRTGVRPRDEAGEGIVDVDGEVKKMGDGALISFSGRL
jgi:hypothetical protein